MSDQPMISWEVKWRAKKNLTKLTLHESAYLREMAPQMAGRIRERTKRGENCRGEPMDALGFFYAKRKRRKGMAGIRDGQYSGQMWRSLTATFDKRDRFRLFFGGTRSGGRIRNQRIADLLAGAPIRSKEEWARREPPSGMGRPPNEFMDATAADVDFLMRTYERMVIARAVRELPTDLSL